MGGQPGTLTPKNTKTLDAAIAMGLKAINWSQQIGTTRGVQGIEGADTVDAVDSATMRKIMAIAHNVYRAVWIEGRVFPLLTDEPAGSAAIKQQTFAERINAQRSDLDMAFAKRKDMRSQIGLSAQI